MRSDSLIFWQQKISLLKDIRESLFESVVQNTPAVNDKPFIYGTKEIEFANYLSNKGLKFDKKNWVELERGYYKFKLEQAIELEKAMKDRIGSGENNRFTLQEELQDLKSKINSVFVYLNRDQNPMNNNFKERHSYKWKVGQAKLDELFKLVFGNLISLDNTYADFLKVFQEHPLKEGFVPLKWHNDNASELLYFISRLQEEGFIWDHTERLDYVQLKWCFVQNDGEPFSKELRVLRAQLHRMSESSKKAVDDVLDQLR